MSEILNQYLETKTVNIEDVKNHTFKNSKYPSILVKYIFDQNKDHKKMTEITETYIMEKCKELDTYGDSFFNCLKHDNLYFVKKLIENKVPCAHEYLITAIVYDKLEILKLLIEYKKEDAKINYLLYYAATYTNSNIFEYLLSLDADINVAIDFAQTDNDSNTINFCKKYLKTEEVKVTKDTFNAETVVTRIMENTEQETQKAIDRFQKETIIARLKEFSRIKKEDKPLAVNIVNHIIFEMSLDDFKDIWNMSKSKFELKKALLKCSQYEKLSYACNN